MSEKKKIDLSEIEIEPVTSLAGLDDLAKDEVFPFKGKDWTIPAVSQETSEKMSAMHGDIKKAVDDEDVEIAMKFDIQYVHVAMSAGMSEKEAKDLTKELRSWPKQVLGKISRFIATTMMGPLGELISEEEKDKAKK
jgi:hypothetical protein